MDAVIEKFRSKKTDAEMAAAREILCNTIIPPAPVDEEPLFSAFSSPFRMGQRVHIDGHKDIKATVLAFAFYAHCHEVSVGWFANGDAKSAWFGVDRLTPAEG